MATDDGSVAPVSRHVVVANEFIRQYYHVLAEIPSQLHRFHCNPDHSGAGAMTNPTLTPAIYSKFMSPGILKCKVDVEKVAAQLSFNDGLFISAEAFLTRDEVKKRFIQSFFLAPTKEGKYYVLNDMLYVPDEPELLSAECIKDPPAPLKSPISVPDEPELLSAECIKDPPAPLKSPISVPDEPELLSAECIKDPPAPLKSPISYASVMANKKGNLHNYKNVPHEQGYAIIVKKLPRQATIKMVQEAFKRFGAIRPGGIDITTPKHGRFSCCIIEYECRQSVQAALEEYRAANRPQDIQVCERRPKTRVASALCDMDDLTASKFRAFLENFQRTGDKKKYYFTEAMVMMERGSPLFSVPFSHLQQTDKYLAMDICCCKRLMPVLRSAAVDFVQQVMLNRSKSVQLSTDEQAVLDGLDLSFAGMPVRLESLHAFLKNRALEKFEVYPQNTELFATPRGCLGLQGILGYIIENHLAGFSWNGKFELEDIIVCNGDKFIITKPPQRFELVEAIPKETAKAFQADLTKICNCLTYYFSIDGMMPPYFQELFSMLLKIPKDALASKRRLEIVYEFIIHHPATKPPIAVANLFTGIHGACDSYDENDTTQFFKNTLKEGEANLWIHEVEEDGNSVLNGVLSYEEARQKKLAILGQTEQSGKPPKGYCHTLESFVEYVRHVLQHGTNYSKKSSPCRRITNADGDVYLENVVPRSQCVRLLDELITMIARLLGKHVLNVIYELLMDSAMHGMLETVWKDYKRSSYVKSIDDDGTA